MIVTKPANYDQAAGQYAAYRQVHTGAFRELRQHNRPVPKPAALKVGCGTGNDISALSEHRG